MLIGMGWLGCGRGSMEELLRQVCPRVKGVSRWLALGTEFKGTF